MKIASRFVLSMVILFSAIHCCVAQEQPLTKKYKEDVIQKLSQMMNDFYVFPEVAKLTEAHLTSQLKNGHFDSINDDEDFAEALTESVQTINKDKHMRIWKNKPYVAPKQTPERMIEERLDRRSNIRNYNAGFHNVQIMEGNVGYLDVRSFAHFGMGKGFADAYMKLIAQTDAVIIDMSKNGGGDPAMVQYLCSFFFEDIVHLNSLYFREGDRTIDFYSLEEVDGEKMPDVPLFVITGEKTFSGAEEFSYNMQTQKRATLIGQTTGGGANPGGTRSINDNLSVFIPTGMAINPITKTNWEGVGVIPEIKTSAEKALEKAHELAKEAAESFRAKTNEVYTTMYRALNKKLEDYQDANSDSAILKELEKCMNEKLLNEEDINMLGYSYLMDFDKPSVAVSIFKANTLLHPGSPNTYDSLAESLMMKDELQESLINYKKAVEIATKNEDPNVEFYQSNVDKVKQMIKEKK